MTTSIATAHGIGGEPRYAQTIRVGSHTLASDEPTQLGGADAGPAPFGLVLAGLAACTGITLRMYADKKGWALGEVEVDLVLVRDAEGAERVDRRITVSPELTVEQRTRLGEIAEKTPVTRTLKRAFPIVTEMLAAATAR